MTMPRTWPDRAMEVAMLRFFSKERSQVTINIIIRIDNPAPLQNPYKTIIEYMVGEIVDTIIEIAAMQYPKAQILKSMQVMWPCWDVESNMPPNGASKSIVPLCIDPIVVIAVLE